MFFNVRELDLRPSSFDTAIAPGIIDFEDQGVRQTGPLVTSGKAELITGSLDEIRVAGHIKVDLEASCDRCLEPAHLSIDGDFDLCYRPVPDGTGEERGIDAGEAEIGFYEGEGLELNEVLREFVLLTLPMQKICKETCKGICPVCGQNRNLNDCQCQTSEMDHRWSALKNLK